MQWTTTYWRPSRHANFGQQAQLLLGVLVLGLERLRSPEYCASGSAKSGGALALDTVAVTESAVAAVTSDTTNDTADVAIAAVADGADAADAAIAAVADAVDGPTRPACGLLSPMDPALMEDCFELLCAGDFVPRKPPPAPTASAAILSSLAVLLSMGLQPTEPS